MRSAGVFAAALVLLAAGCGGESASRNPAKDAAPPPKVAPRIDGPIPGPVVPGSFSDEQGRPVADVHELETIGSGRRRVALLMGRRARLPCIGAAAPGVEVVLDCLERWESPPLFVRVVVGGDEAGQTEWLAVAGVARRPTAHVTMQPQSEGAQTLRLRSWPKFEWRPFAAMTRKGNLANMLTATDEQDEVVVRVEVSWAYDALQATGPWTEVRDPVRAASGADDTSHPIVFAHPAIRRLVAGRTFFVNPTAGWEKCNGESFGAVVGMRFHPPAEFKGEIPIHEYAEEGEDVAYREGRAYIEATNITAAEAWVDLNRRRVVGIDLEAHDSSSYEESESADIERRDVLEEPKPAGGPDDSKLCPQHELGD